MTSLTLVKDHDRALLKPVTAAKLHWRDLGPSDRLSILGVIEGLGADHLVAVGLPLIPRRQERARRQCLGTLLVELERWGVERLCLEARTSSLNRKDIGSVTAFRAQRRISRIRVEHVQPQESLTWIADVVAGARAAARAGDHTCAGMLQDVVIEIDVSLN